MNERLKLLAEQATIKTSHKYHTWGDRIATETKEVFDKEKFAELIVRECAEIAYNKQYKHSAAHTRGDCAEAIKQHFGVKE